jgi:hypothetical protein
MKKLLIALATTVVLVGPAAATAHAGSAVCAVVLKTSDGFLALRDGPGVGHRLLKKLPRGEKLDMFEPGDNAWESAKRNAWVKVIYGLDVHAGVTGWVSSRYIQTFDCE